MKRTGIFTWLLGWGVFTNARSISQIKDNLHILQSKINSQINKLNNWPNI